MKAYSLFVAVVFIAFSLSTRASAYYPQFAERYYNPYGARYYQPYRYVSPYRPHGYYPSPRRDESNYPTYRYDWSWGGGSRGYLGGRGGGWGGEW